MITLKRYQLVLLMVGAALSALALNSCKWNSASADNLYGNAEIKYQTAPDGRECRVLYQNGDARGLDCSR